MKWPNTLVLIRHGESAYNIQKIAQEEDPEYQEFKKLYNRFERNPDKYGEAAREMARLILKEGKYRLPKGDHETPLTDHGKWQAETTGRALAEMSRNTMPLPDIIMVSPYKRTKQTLGHLAIGWPELADVRTIEESRLREQEHGQRALYGDWRVYNVLHPEQMELRQMQGAYWYRHLQGESVEDVRERTRSLIGTVIRDFHEQNVWWVTHHLTKLSLRANFERFGEEKFLQLDADEKPVNCGVTIYKGDPDKGTDGKLLLDQYNTQLY